MHSFRISEVKVLLKQTIKLEEAYQRVQYFDRKSDLLLELFKKQEVGRRVFANKISIGGQNAYLVLILAGVVLGYVFVGCICGRLVHWVFARLMMELGR